MTPEDILAMARKAGLYIRGHYDESGSTPKELERFAKLISEFDPVRAAREAKKEQALTRMAKEAGWGTGSDREDECVTCGRFDLELFAALVADEEREACAEVCDEWIKNGSELAEDIAAAIRARGKK